MNIPDTKTLAIRIRNELLNNVGISINVEQTPASDYKYTITNGCFTLEVYRDNKNEVDTLLQIVFYLSSAPHIMAFREANAYNNSLIVVEAALKREPKSKALSDARADIQQRLRQANIVELFKAEDFENFNIRNLNQITSINTVGLEDAKRKIPWLYSQLKNLADVCFSHNLEYETLISIDESSSEQI